MTLTLIDRLRFAYSSLELWMGMIVLLAGIFIVGEVDWLNLYFYLTPTTTAPGRISTIYPTSFEEDDVAIRGFTYRYQVAGLEWAGNSYSTDSTKRPGMVTTIEYCVNRPAISRLQGTNIAPFGAVSLLASVTFSVAGFTLAFKSIRRTRRLLALIADAALVEATRERVLKQIPADGEGDVEYDLYYRYYANQQQHTLLITTTNPSLYRPQELVAYERSAPTNAALLSSLPVSIQTQIAKNG